MTFERRGRKTIAKTDWSDLYRRLEVARTTAEATIDIDRHGREQVLRARAANMASARSSAKPDSSPGQHIEVIAFASAGEHYAFETAFVGQVHAVGSITSIPGTPNFVVGIIALQGEVLSVIDLRSFLNLPLSSLSEPTSIIVLKGETMEFGVLADEILGIESYPIDSLQRELSAGMDVGNTYLSAVTVGRTAVLDARRLLTDPRLVVEIS
jgi:purine-binding chemotaxis protein CheW